MKVGIIASLLIHVGGLALIPNREPPQATSSFASAAEESCRCDYEVTITDARPPRALTLGEVPPNRLKQ